MLLCFASCLTERIPRYTRPTTYNKRYISRLCLLFEGLPYLADSKVSVKYIRILHNFLTFLIVQLRFHQ